MDLKRRIQGDFHVIEETEDRIVLGNRACPFGELVRENDLIRELAPAATTEIDVEVTARSNGLTPVTVEVRTPLGSPLTEPVEFTARVNNLTGIGRVVTVGLLIVLATWWFTYFKRRRRDRHEALVSESITRHPANGEPQPVGD